MARKRRRSSRPSFKAVTAKRAARLLRILTVLGSGPQTRSEITRRLRLDLRAFYRDLRLLRASGIKLSLINRRYALKGALAAAIARLPFPDPHLILGEAIQLAKGRSPAHRTLQDQIASIVHH
jgi:hypothetical protein